MKEKRKKDEGEGTLRGTLNNVRRHGGFGLTSNGRARGGEGHAKGERTRRRACNCLSLREAEREVFIPSHKAVQASYYEHKGENEVGIRMLKRESPAGDRTARQLEGELGRRKVEGRVQ